MICTRKQLYSIETLVVEPRTPVSLGVLTNSLHCLSCYRVIRKSELSDDVLKTRLPTELGDTNFASHIYFLDSEVGQLTVLWSLKRDLLVLFERLVH